MPFIYHTFYTHDSKTLRLLLMEILKNFEGKKYQLKTLKKLQGDLLALLSHLKLTLNLN